MQGSAPFFMSELQLVKFYSDRKLITPLSDSTGLESVQPVRSRGPVGLREELWAPFQTCRASGVQALQGLDTSGALRPQQTRGSMPGAPPHRVCWAGSGLCRRTTGQAGASCHLNQLLGPPEVVGREPVCSAGQRPPMSTSHPWNQCVRDTTEQRDTVAVFRDLVTGKPTCTGCNPEQNSQGRLLPVASGQQCLSLFQPNTRGRSASLLRERAWSLTPHPNQKQQDRAGSPSAPSLPTSQNRVSGSS